MLLLVACGRPVTEGVVEVAITPVAAAATATTTPTPSPVRVATKTARPTWTIPPPAPSPPSVTPTKDLRFTPVPPPPLPDLTLSTIHMVTATEGWGTDRDHGIILRTMDGGIHWRNVSPPGASPAPPPSAFFVDSTEAWAAVAPAITSALEEYSPTDVRIWHTKDGGQNWNALGQLHSPVGIAGGLQFIDDQHGWLSQSLGAAMGSEGIAIWATEDGGLHWMQRSVTSFTPGESTPGAMPVGCDKAGPVFLDQGYGWITGSCAVGLFFYGTHDGGRTWQEASQVFHVQFDPTNPESDVSYLQFSSRQDGVLLMHSYSNNREHQRLYLTYDGGASWQPQVVPDTDYLGRPFFLNGQTGWVIGGKMKDTWPVSADLYRTDDGGVSWRTIPLDGNWNGADIDFVSSQAGWLLQGYSGPQQRDMLTRTLDGGQSWQAITPQLVHE